MKKLILASALLASCGTEQASDLDIVGGSKVYRSWYGRVGGCGSTLIAKRWAVSAKHCFTRSNPKKAVFGLYKRNDPNNGGKPKHEVDVKRIILHPKIDLALIELKTNVKFTPRKLSNARLSNGEKLHAFGFGQTSHPGRAPEFLQGAVFRFNAKATANARPEIIRAGAPGKAICFGDSGGPLMYQGRLIATSTFTVSKCQPGGMMGFTRLDVNWIRKNI